MQDATKELQFKSSFWVVIWQCRETLDLDLDLKP